jgi:hypothetical protein
MTGSSCDASGNCTYTFTHVVPANAKGTYTIGIEGRLSITLLPGTTQAVTTSYGGTNQIINFSVDGSAVTPRRTVVAMANCKGCHTYLEVHGVSAQQRDVLRVCHNPSRATNHHAPTATGCGRQGRAESRHQLRTDDPLHPHRDKWAAPAGLDYVIVGGSHNSFGGVRHGPGNDSQYRRPLSGHAERLGGRHGQLHHVPHRRFARRAPGRQEPVYRPGGADQSGSGHYVGLHGLPFRHCRRWRTPCSTPSRSLARAARFATGGRSLRRDYGTRRSVRQAITRRRPCSGRHDI